MLTDAWYLAAWSHELEGKPFARKFLGRPVVLFRGRQGHAQALDAVCPHRGGDLGRGRLVSGGL